MASPRLCATKAVYRTIDRVWKKFTDVGLRPPIQYVIVTKTVGRASSIGSSAVVLAMKYDDSLYIPEDLSFSSINLSRGKVKIA